VGLSFTLAEAKNKFALVSTKDPYYITPSVLFLGEIPRTNDFESKTSMFIDQDVHVDDVPDDSGLVIIQDKRLIIISGCAHSGICNMTEYASSITGINNIAAVIGGFHLKHQSQELTKTILYLKEKRVNQIYPSHCTKLPALSAFYESFRIKQLKSGMTLEF